MGTNVLSKRESSWLHLIRFILLFNWAVRFWRPRFLVELVRCAVRAACVCGRGRMKKENPWWCAIQRRAKSDATTTTKSQQQQHGHRLRRPNLWPK